MELRENGDNSISQKSPYYYLSKYRSELMGFAILWVVWFHSSVHFDFFPVSVLNNAFSFAKGIGYGGVDIFLFVSGMGIYNSLEKNDISKYIKNRIRRIVPVWWLFLIVSIFLGRLVLKVYFSKLEIIGIATFTAFWLNMPKSGNWYVYAIMLLYLVSPVFYSFFKNSKNKLKTCILLISIALIVSVPFFHTSKLIAFSRISVYLLGMYVSSSLRNTGIKKPHWIVLIITFVFGLMVMLICYGLLRDYVWSYGLWWYPFIIIAPTLSLLIAKFMDFLKTKIKPLILLLSILGKSSMEIMLASDIMIDNANSGKFNFLILNSRISSVFWVIASLLAGIAFHYLIDYIITRLNKRRKIKLC